MLSVFGSSYFAQEAATPRLFSPQLLGQIIGERFESGQGRFSPDPFKFIILTFDTT
jgi:hypothetical protein